MLAAADTTRHQPRRGHGGPLDNLARRQRAAIERMVPPGLIDLATLRPPARRLSLYHLESNFPHWACPS